MTTPFPFQAGATLLASQLNSITELIINDKTDSYTLVAGDAGEYVIMNKATATTITVPNSVFTAGQIVRIVNKGGGVCTLTAGAGTTVSSTGTLALAQNATGTLIALSASAFIFEAGGVTSTSAVAQVKSTAKTDTFATSTTLTWVDITGLSQSITPTSASNKVLVQFVIGSFVSSASDRIVAFRIVRGSTAVGVGDVAGDRTPATSAVYTVGAGTDSQSISGIFLDSPATTSATTYKIQVHLSAAATVDINKVGGDNNSSAFTRQISTITCSEVAP